MKKLIFTILVAFAATSLNAKDICKLIVTTNPPMTCQNCENKIKKGDLRFEKGVKNIETNLAEQRVVITYDADKTTPEKIEQAFEKIGYKAIPIEDAAKNECNENSEKACCGGSNCGEK